MTIGLKGSWKETKGGRLRYRLLQLKWNLKYAWQRAWQGYDSRDVFDMDFMFIEKEKEILKDYRKNHHGLFNVPKEYEDIFNKDYFDESETNMIIEMMVFHLEMLNEDYVEKLLYGKNIFDDDYNFDVDFSIDKSKHVHSIVEQNKNAFMKLFNVFFWELWD